MKSFNSMVVATDFSIDGNNAVRRAALLAHEHGARLKLVHVLDPAGCKPLRDWSSPRIDIDLKAAQARESLRRFAIEIAALAMITAVVPGTVWAELAPDRSALLIHVFDLDDEAAFIRHFKTDYEQPLKEIFE